MNRNPTNQQQQQQQQQRRATQPSSSLFQGCPLSKFITLTTIFSHIILEKGGFSGGTDLLNLNLEDILVHGEAYRLFLHTATFSTVGELVTGIMVLVPFLTQFEREMGTKKFGSFLLVKSLLLSTILQLAFVVLIDGVTNANDNANTNANTNNESFYFAPGPYSLIGSLFYLYHAYTPRLDMKFIGILGFDFSEKAMKYLFTIVMINSRGLASIIPTICGFIAAGISISPKNIYGRWECVLPKFAYGIATSIGRVFGLDQLVTTSIFMNRSGSTNTNASTGIRRTANLGTRGGAGAGVGLGGAPAAAPQPQFQPMPRVQPPSPEVIEQLTAMGFERDASIRALGTTDNNVEAAANRLLSGA